MVVLETERMRLRTFVDEDAASILELDSDPEVVKYVRVGSRAKPVSMDEVVDVYLKKVKFLNAVSRTYGFLAAVDKENDAFMGWFQFEEKEPDTAELGYRLKQPYWGRGFATEGSLALIRKGFTDWGVTRVTASALKENESSLRVMAKCGLGFVASFMFEGRWPAETYTLSRNEWLETSGGQYPSSH